MFGDTVSLFERERESERGNDSWCVCVCLYFKQRDGGREASFFREQATPKYTNPPFLCFPTGLWIQMSPPLDSAPAGDQQCVTDRQVEPAVALDCVSSNWPWLSSAWSYE